MTREQWEQSKPALSREEEEALSVWHFCRGWDPRSIPLAAAYHGVRDMPRLLDNLLILRGALEQREEETRRSHGR